MAFKKRIEEAFLHVDVLLGVKRQIMSPRDKSDVLVLRACIQVSFYIATQVQ